MNISYNWLKEYVKIDADVPTLCAKLTAAGIEVEAVTKSGNVPQEIVAAKILERKPHPDSDHMSVCKVFDGKEELQIVCGAPNCDAGKIVPMAPIGTVFKTPEGEFKIKKSKLRGVESFGMLCAADEICVGTDHSGLLILDDAVKPGTPVASLFGGDSCIEVEVTPNRPDWLSHWGIARDVACICHAQAVLPELKMPAQVPAPANLVTVEAPDLCRRYIGRLIRGVKIAESPEWLKQKLTSIGLRPINNVVDVTNFILMELGQPLHAFDADLLAEHRVVARRAKKGEHIVTLDGKDLELSEENLVIADAEKPMALAGVMGGEFSGVTEKTVNVLLESACFDKSNIRFTSRNLGIASDSSYRFERGTDYDMAEYAGNRAAQLIMELAQGKELTEPMDVTPGRPAEKVIPCRFERIRALLGLSTSNEEIVSIFRELHLKVDDVTNDACVVTAPLFRLDLEREADLAEEVGRIVGLDNIPELPVFAKSVSSFRDDCYAPIQAMRNQLVSLGLWECVHYSMLSEAQALTDSRFAAANLMKLTNPLSLEYAALRPSLFGTMLATVERNIARRNLSFALFDLDRAFCADSKQFPEERLECCIAMTGLRHPERFSAEQKEEIDFYDLKGVVESFLSLRGVGSVVFNAAQDARFADGACAEVKVNGRLAGHFGKVAPALVKGFRTTYPVYMAVLDADYLLKLKSRAIQYQPASPFPATSRDVAFVADATLTHAAVVDFVRKSKIENVENVELFDIFTDEKVLSTGKKSMAYKFTFRNNERTLKDAEVNAAFEKLRSRLAAELKVELR